MLISDSKKMIFIHIQKTGGSSLRYTLKDMIPDLEENRGVKYHAPLSDILKSYPRLRCGEYYTIAFIRNPWDRLVSWYSDISSNENYCRMIHPARTICFDKVLCVEHGPLKISFYIVMICRIGQDGYRFRSIRSIILRIFLGILPSIS